MPMSRDHKKLRVFALADQVAFEVYRATATFALVERYGLQAQLRRAAVSTAANIVEGCARTTTKDYVHFLTSRWALQAKFGTWSISHIDSNSCPSPAAESLEALCGELVRSLQKMVTALAPSP